MIKQISDVIQKGDKGLTFVAFLSLKTKIIHELRILAGHKKTQYIVIDQKYYILCFLIWWGW